MFDFVVYCIFSKIIRNRARKSGIRLSSVLDWETGSPANGLGSPARGLRYELISPMFQSQTGSTKSGSWPDVRRITINFRPAVTGDNLLLDSLEVIEGEY